MPLAVTNAAPAGTFPAHLAQKWQRTRNFAGRINEYPDGSCQRAALASSSRSEIPISLRLQPAEVAAFRDFYQSVNGPHGSFYFYDPAETNPPFTSSPAGSTGRYVGRFKGPASFRSDKSFTYVDFVFVQLT
jgi:hypothetical protein